ncbi:MAG TPA: hypothetical protein VNS58_21465 [Puia sp.]|nr:hypothetical protein [Puia sp.]
MTELEIQLLRAYDAGKITRDILLEKFPTDLQSDLHYVAAAVRAAIQTTDAETIDRTILLIWLSGNPGAFTDLLNDLLIDPHHHRHQAIAKTLQDIKSPSTIPFVEKALATNFDYLFYTCSDSDAIAKWFSWILYEIGTPTAIKLMERYANNPNEGIQKEMRYRLVKVKNDHFKK